MRNKNIIHVPLSRWTSAARRRQSYDAAGAAALKKQLSRDRALPRSPPTPPSLSPERLWTSRREQFEDQPNLWSLVRVVKDVFKHCFWTEQPKPTGSESAFTQVQDLRFKEAVANIHIWGNEWTAAEMDILKDGDLALYMLALELLVEFAQLLRELTARRLKKSSKRPQGWKSVLRRLDPVVEAAAGTLAYGQTEAGETQQDKSKKITRPTDPAQFLIDEWVIMESTDTVLDALNSSAELLMDLIPSIESLIESQCIADLSSALRQEIVPTLRDDKAVHEPESDPPELQHANIPVAMPQQEKIPEANEFGASPGL